MGRASRFLRGLRSFPPGILVDDLEAIERIARRRVIITAPVGRCHQEEYDANPHQAHKSTWLPQDFREIWGG
jgi:hypothetical protein